MTASAKAAEPDTTAPQASKHCLSHAGTNSPNATAACEAPMTQHAGTEEA